MAAKKKTGTTRAKRVKRNSSKNVADMGITTALKHRLQKMGAVKKCVLNKRNKSRKAQSIAPRRKTMVTRRLLHECHEDGSHATVRVPSKSSLRKKSTRMTAAQRGTKVHDLVSQWVKKQLLVPGVQFTAKSIETIVDTRYPGLTRAARAVAQWVVEHNLVPVFTELVIGANKVDMVVKNRLSLKYEIVEIKSKFVQMSKFKADEKKQIPGFSAKQMTSEADQNQLQLAEYRRCVKTHLGLSYIPFGRLVYTFTTGHTLSRDCEDKYLKFKPK